MSRLGPFALVILVPAIALVRLVQGGSLLLGDRSIFALQVTDVVRGRFPSVGLYSWHGWNHPGPIAFYAFAPFHWVMAGSPAAMLVGAAVWNAAFGALAVRTVTRRHRGAGYAVVVMMCLVWFASGATSAADPWTPYLALPVLVWFLCGVWGTVERDRSAVWAMCLSAAILVQVHVGYVPVTVVVGVVALVTYWRGGGAVTQLSRPLVAGLALFTPLVFHPMASARNVGDLVRYFVSGGEATVGFVRGMRMVATEFSPHASWLGGARESGVIGEAPVSSIWWSIAFAALVVGAAFGAREHPRLRAVVPCVIASFVAMSVSVVQVRGFAFPYVVLFRAPIVIATLMWMIAVLLARRPAPRPVTMAASTFVVTVCLVVSVVSTTSRDTITDDADAVREVVSTATSNVGSEPILLRLGDGGLVGLYPELVRWFEQHDVGSGIEKGTEWVFGRRALEAGSAAEVWFVCDTGVVFSLLSTQPGARVIAEHTPFSPAQESDVVGLQSRLANRLRSLGDSFDLSVLDSPLVSFALTSSDVDQELVAELGVLNSRTPEPGDRFGIVAFAPDEIPDIWWSLDAPGTE